MIIAETWKDFGDLLELEMEEGNSAAPQLHHLPIQTGFNVGGLASRFSFTEQMGHLKENSGVPSCKIIKGLAPRERFPECCLAAS